MKLQLVVKTQGKMNGKSIPVPLSQFLIGRDPQCHLRPASALISKRHCAVLIKGDRAFVRDFNSTNGTMVNDQAVKGESELKDGDSLKVGPLEFQVALELTPPVNVATPFPANPATAAQADEAAAAMLLSGVDDAAGVSPVDSDGVPTGSTVMEMLHSPADTAAEKEPKSGGAEREKAAKMAQGNTSTAAKAILEKYMRRPRG